MKKHLSQGWQLMQQSWSILRANKSLLIFPFSSLLLCLGLLALISRPLWEAEQSYFLHRPSQSIPHIWIILVILALFFFVCHYIMALSNSALIASLKDYFENQPVNIRQGLRLAFRHWFNLLVWTLITTTIGAGVRIVESWSKYWESLSLVLSYLGGLSWLLATYFVIPILIFENSDPFVAIKRSSYLMRNTWGQVIKMNFGFGLITVGLRLIALIPVLIAASIGGHNTLIAGASITIVLWLTVSLFISATYMILSGALYEFARQGDVAHFNKENLQKAFLK